MDSDTETNTVKAFVSFTNSSVSKSDFCASDEFHGVQ